MLSPSWRTTTMLHHYSYNNPLSQFLGFHHQLEDQNQSSDTDHQTQSRLICDDQTDSRYRTSSSTPSGGKSFTIAAILGLNSDASEVVNLSVHHGGDRGLGCGRLQLSGVRHGGTLPVGGVTGQYGMGPVCPTRPNGTLNAHNIIFWVVLLMKLNIHFTCWYTSLSFGKVQVLQVKLGLRLLPAPQGK